jgi:hypothetical protein
VSCRSFEREHPGSPWSLAREQIPDKGNAPSKHLSKPLFVRPQHRCDRGDVETPGGLRLEAKDSYPAVAVTPAQRDRLSSRARPCTAPCRSFEGKHPGSPWSLARDEQIPDTGYAPSEHLLKPWPARPYQEIGALFFRDNRIGFNSPFASAALIADSIVSRPVSTELVRVVRHDVPDRTGDLKGRPPDVGSASERDRCTLDISPSRRGARANEPRRSGSDPEKHQR